jgi:radical SAM enzyme (TIGR01210 family)
MLSDDSGRPLASWSGHDRIGDRILDSFTVILKTGGCAWNRCLMCSYRHERYTGLSAKDLSARLMEQLTYIRDHADLRQTELVKIYTSGSFFDPAEVAPEVRSAAAELFRGKMIIAETRPEFVDAGVLEEFSSQIDDGTHEQPLSVAIGVETSNDATREKSIQKGFSWAQFLHAVGEAKRAGAGVKGYLLMKPPFLTEQEAVQDMHRSIADVRPHAHLISLNPCSVQRQTELERLWKQGEYRPPYLWSILAVIRASPVHLTVDPLGGGLSRGPHNCGSCDAEILKGIRDYSLSGDRTLIEEISRMECACKPEWTFVMEREKSFCMPLTR